MSTKLLCLFAALLTLRATAATITATSASDAAVQAAVNAAANGDTVLIPAGKVVWSTGVSTGKKSLTLAGAGIDVTIITNNVSGTWPPALNITLDPSTFFTLSNCSFATIPSPQSGIVTISGSPPKCQFRVSYCKFYVAPTGTITTGYRGLSVGGTYGVIDHCYFRNTSLGGHGLDVNYDGYGLIATNWYIPQIYGDTNTVVIEDCVFDFENIADNCLDVYSSCKFVFRYNTLTNTSPGWHGADSDARGVRLFEIYQNKFYSKNGYHTAYAAMARSGSGVMWSNTTDAGYQSLFALRVYRADPGYTGSCGGPAGWMDLPPGGLQGACNGSRIVDGNFDASGYPALDQVGRGSFPSWPPVWTNHFSPAQYETLEGVYQWGNNLGGNIAPLCGIGDYSYTTNINSFLKPGRDYFDNTVKPGYAALAYPHPLVSGAAYIPPPTMDASPPGTNGVLVLKWLGR